MDGATRAVLLIADISGFTRFMKQSTISTSHAKQVVVRLLKALVRTSRIPMKVAELEGDAVFLYAPTPSGRETAVAERVRDQMVDLFRAFEKEKAEIDKLRTCACDACSQVADLRLKQVVHLGEVSTERIGGFDKLFGFDVIVVHRMLKNSVPEREYVMMTEDAYGAFGDFLGLPVVRRTEQFEGVGEIATVVVYPGDAVRAEEQPVPATFIRKWLWRIRITLGTMFDVYGLRRIPGTFTNVPVTSPEGPSTGTVFSRTGVQ